RGARPGGWGRPGRGHAPWGLLSPLLGPTGLLQLTLPGSEVRRTPAEMPPARTATGRNAWPATAGACGGRERVRTGAAAGPGRGPVARRQRWEAPALDPGALGMSGRRSRAGIPALPGVVTGAAAALPFPAAYLRHTDLLLADHARSRDDADVLAAGCVAG